MPTITGGYARTGQGYPITWPLRRPDCAVSRLLDGARLAGDPVNSDSGARLVPTLDRTTPAEALGVPPHPGADGLVQGERAAHSTEF